MIMRIRAIAGVAACAALLGCAPAQTPTEKRNVTRDFASATRVLLPSVLSACEKYLVSETSTDLTAEGFTAVQKHSFRRAFGPQVATGNLLRPRMQRSMTVDFEGPESGNLIQKKERECRITVLPIDTDAHQLLVEVRGYYGERGYKPGLPKRGTVTLSKGLDTFSFRNILYIDTSTAELVMTKNRVLKLD